jgi:peroxiredoxin
LCNSYSEVRNTQSPRSIVVNRLNRSHKHRMSESIVVAGFILQALTLFTLAVFLFQLLKQQGRILLRLDALDSTRLTRDDAETSRRGLDIGTAIGNFELRDLTGQTTSLSHFRGRRVLLIYWGAECGFCDMTAAALTGMQTALEENQTQLLLVAYGDTEANRKVAAEHGLSCPILLLDGSTTQASMVSTAFQYCGTPSAYLLDEKGRVSRPLAAGMEQVLDLARDATVKRLGPRKLPLAASRIERNGLRKGAIAPTFSLPDIHGETVSLGQFRGRIVLLVFSDPQCGPCDELAPKLVYLHRKQSNKGIAIVMIGRGQADQNRAKAMHHGIRFPVVLQDRWKLSREYGIFDTPVAFLIDRDGIIMSDVAKGPDRIMELAQEGLASAKETRYASIV